MTARTPRPFRLRAVLFDFDGTLTRPGALDFAALKHSIGCPPERFVLEWIEALAEGPQRREALAALERFELAGAETSEPNAGAEELIERLRAAGLKVGVLTRNGRAAVDAALARFTRLDASAFDVVITRDDEPAPKPAPDGVLHAAAAMDVPAAELLVVGDYVLDVLAGRAAGAVTVYLTNGGTTDAAGETAAAALAHAAAGAPADEAGDARDGSPDFVVHGLAELDDVVRLGLPLAPGKLPNDLLAGHLAFASGPTDPAVLVPAGVGEDVVALDIGGCSTLVAHGDPITLTGEHLGHFAALVNANDVATVGADPRWLLTTVLLPPGTTASQALDLLADVAVAAATAGAPVVGGHTEVTDAVTRPVVSVTALGTVARDQLRDKRSIRPGDRVILTKALAVEGTAILATEASERLLRLGMSEAELAECRALLPLMSIVPEARLAAGYGGVHAMHDVTEGGLATAVRELCHAGRHGIRVECDAVPVLPQTARVCALLDADPLGLIASGSLLICCEPGDAGSLAGALAASGVRATVIGEVGAPGEEVSALAGRRAGPLAGLRHRRGGAAARGGLRAGGRGGRRRDPRGRRASRRSAGTDGSERRQAPVDVELVAQPAQLVADPRDGRRGRHRHQQLHGEERGAGVGRRAQRRLGALDVDVQARQQVRDRLHEPRVVHRPGRDAQRKGRGRLRRRGRRLQLRVHAGLLLQCGQAGLELLHGGRGAGHEEHHRELPVQVDHAAVLEVAALVVHEARDGVDQPGVVRADGGEHDVG